MVELVHHGKVYCTHHSPAAAASLLLREAYIYDHPHRPRYHQSVAAPVGRGGAKVVGQLRERSLADMECRGEGGKGRGEEQSKSDGGIALMLQESLEPSL